MPPAPGCAESPHVSVIETCQDGLCRIPAGCYLMGRNPDEYPPGVYANETLVEVLLTRAFFIGQHEVTIGEWEAAGFAVPTGLPDSGSTGCYEAECPVGHLSWYEALAYSNWLSEQQELAPCFTLQGCTGTMGVDFACEDMSVNAESVYACEGYRLPTEAEWEYAARAGTRTTFYSGEITRHADSHKCLVDPALDPVAWYCGNSNGEAHPIGLKQPNAWGLYDVLGNGAEWLYDGGYSARPPDPRQDPVRRTSGHAALAGGVYSMRASFHRAANRMRNDLANSRRWPSNGFRIARTDHGDAGGP